MQLVRYCLLIVFFLAISLLLLNCGGGSGSGSGWGSGSASTPTGTALGLNSANEIQDNAGAWWASISTLATALEGGHKIPVVVDLILGEGVLQALTMKNAKLDKVVLLLTAERLFDGNGWQHRGSDEGMSTLLTPSGLPIQGGSQGAISPRFNKYPYRTPVDELVELPLPPIIGKQSVTFQVSASVMQDLPPGLYRLRVNFGVRANYSSKANPDNYVYYDLHYSNFTRHPFHDGSYFFSSPLLPASGMDVTGKNIDANAIQARIPWTILNGYNSNGYSGVVCDEDSARFALGQLSLIQDEVVLPRYYTGGNYTIGYNLEPVFPFETYYTRDGIDWDWTRGEMSLEITNPDGAISSQPATPIVAKSSSRMGPTTKNSAFTAWKPPMYGHYSVRLKGWMQDTSGRRYEGGGTYGFWVARRMTMATATFPGMAYQTGYQYGRDISFSPPLPAEVEITATLYPNSDPAQANVVSSKGTATAGGIFGVAQGMKQLPLNLPGEYHGKIFARYTDRDGELWICTMRHAGVVYPADSGIVARGKKLKINNTYVDRGETNFEGYYNSPTDYKMPHITFPYNPGDLLLMASENQGYNKIEPVLIYEDKGVATSWDSALDDVGRTNLYMQTSNGLSPHMFPEYITARQYYYAAAPRPGFMSRFLVGDSSMRAPYWPTSPNDFGGQIGSSYNGDQPGDLYRFIGGVVRQETGKTPTYAGYISSGAILPKGSNNNRVVAPGSADIVGSKGEKARIFLTPGFRPGMAYMLGATWRPALQIDPLLPVTVSLTLTFPDGSSIIDGGVASAADGSWAGQAQTLDQPGVYRYSVSASWGGFTGTIPGLPANGGEFYVMGPKPAGVQGLIVDRSKESIFSLSDKLRIAGRSTGSTVHYALIMPGAVIAQGEATVVNGAFEIVLDPGEINRSSPIYDLINRVSGLLWASQPANEQWKSTRKILHLSLFSKEKTTDGTEYWDFHRIITRGTTVLSVK
ncbi:MAG: hypothetical protein HXX11_17400 [Desulfuromonadales bacterium]|nr:hypothetical protein [Desulfuromonadales bacterium]